MKEHHVPFLLKLNILVLDNFVKQKLFRTSNAASYFSQIQSVAVKNNDETYRQIGI